jgi:uncharacterized protein (DUF1697 family)
MLSFSSRRNFTLPWIVAIDWRAMAVYVSMLRGINLGKRRVKMEDLRALYESLGLTDAKTYVQSGNVVFKSKLKDERKLASLIEKGIAQRFGFESGVVLRSADELEAVVAANPFAKRKDVHPGKLLVWFVREAPTAAVRKAVLAVPADPEELKLGEREIYCYFPNGQARPGIKWASVEKALAVPGTGRNWNSVMQLLDMARAMEAGE